MSSILDIDLDYFNLVSDPLRALSELLSWASRPVSIIADCHAQAVRRWLRLVAAGTLSTPTHILHADEHHDMMNEKAGTNPANVMYRAMVLWPDCRVFWMAEDRIDAPDMWLEPETWSELRKRFRMGKKRPAKWPKPDLVSICTSPGFVSPELRDALIKKVGIQRDREAIEPGDPAGR